MVTRYGTCSFGQNELTLQVHVLDTALRNVWVLKGEASPSIYADWVNGG